MKIIQWSGDLISAPGIYAGIPMDAYHGQLTVGPSISSSGLRTIFYESPRHYFRDSYLNPNRKDRSDSSAFAFGRAAHHLLLGESHFSKHFVLRPAEVAGAPWQSNRLPCRRWIIDQRAAGLTVVTEAEMDAIRGMAESLASEPLVQAGILNGLIEHSFVWQDAKTGVWLKWRPDAVPTDSMDFSDLKTTTSVRHQDLERAIANYGYHLQGALGALACEALLGQPMNSFSLVFVEKTDPWCVRTKTIRESDIALGRRCIAAALTAFRSGLDTGVWQGPGGTQTDTEYSGVPEWAHTSASYRIEELEGETA